MSRSLTRLIRLVTITPLVLLMLVRVVAAAEPKTIVVLNSYCQNFKPWSEYSKALRQELERRSSWPLIIDDFSVTTARVQFDVGVLECLLDPQNMARLFAN
jgi:hypothetical protein